MPTLLIQNGYRFFFYSNENNEPAHLHVNKGGADGKLWLEPSLKIAYFYNFNTSEQKEILAITKANLENFKLRWNEYFNQ